MIDPNNTYSSKNYLNTAGEITYLPDFTLRVDTLNSTEPYCNDRYQVQCNRYANRRNRKLYISEWLRRKSAVEGAISGSSIDITSSWSALELRKFWTLARWMTSNEIKSFYSLIKYKYVYTWQYSSWTNKAIKLLQLPNKQNINQK